MYSRRGVILYLFIVISIREARTTSSEVESQRSFRDSECEGESYELGGGYYAEHFEECNALVVNRTLQFKDYHWQFYSCIVRRGLQGQELTLKSYAELMSLNLTEGKREKILSLLEEGSGLRATTSVEGVDRSSSSATTSVTAGGGEGEGMVATTSESSVYFPTTAATSSERGGEEPGSAATSPEFNAEDPVMAPTTSTETLPEMLTSTSAMIEAILSTTTPGVGPPSGPILNDGESGGEDFEMPLGTSMSPEVIEDTKAPEEVTEGSFDSEVATERNELEQQVTEENGIDPAFMSGLRVLREVTEELEEYVSKLKEYWGKYFSAEFRVCGGKFKKFCSKSTKNTCEYEDCVQKARNYTEPPYFCSHTKPLILHPNLYTKKENQDCVHRWSTTLTIFTYSHAKGFAESLCYVERKGLLKPTAFYSSSINYRSLYRKLVPGFWPTPVRKSFFAEFRRISRVQEDIPLDQVQPFQNYADKVFRRFKLLRWAKRSKSGEKKQKQVIMNSFPVMTMIRTIHNTQKSLCSKS